MTISRSRERKRLWRMGDKAGALVSLTIFIAVAIYVMYPASLHLGSLVIGRPFEDAFECIWYLGWYSRAIFDLKVSPLFQPDIFYPTGWDLRFATFPPLYPVVLAPVTRILGPVLVYNASVLATFVLAAYGVYLWAKELGANWWGATFGGIAYAFYPHRETYLGGHLGFLFASLWLPWMAYGLTRAARQDRSPIRWGAFAGLALGLSVAGTWQYVFIGGVALLLFLGGTFLKDRKRWDGRRLRVFLSFAVTWAVVFLPQFLGAWGVLTERRELGESTPFAFQETDSTSVSIERLLVPSGINPLWGDFARKTFPLHNGIDAVVNFGYTAIVLACYGFRKSDFPEKGGLAWLIGGGLVLMLGTSLHFWGKPVLIPVPDAIQRFIRSVWQLRVASPLPEYGQGKLPVFLPWVLIYWLLPQARSLRSFGRWGVVVALGVSVLAALGLTHLSAKVGKKHLWLSGLALLLLVVEINTQPLPSVTPIQQMHREVDDWLAATPQRSTIIEYPLWYTGGGQTLYYTMAHGQRIVHGPPSVAPTEYRQRLPLLNQWPGKETLDYLKGIGVRYVLVHAFQGDEFETEDLPVLLDNPRLRLIRRFSTSIGFVRDIYLFELLD